MGKCRENTAPRPLSRLDFMGRSRALPIVLSLAIAAALGLVACGSGSDADLLPGDTASEINSNLDQVEQLANEGDCLGASDAAQAVSLQVEELSGVDAKLKQALQEGATRLNEVVAGCEEAAIEEETVPSIEDAEVPEEEEKKAEKPEKPKPEKKAEEPEEEESSPTLPPQAEGEAKGHEKQEEEVPPAEPGGETPSGGVGPSTPAGGE
jgi:outer membrane biosynthesis protein TonB